MHTFSSSLIIIYFVLPGFSLVNAYPDHHGIVTSNNFPTMKITLASVKGDGYP